MSTETVIVVVEDDPNIADLVELYLRRDGFRVYQAADGETALKTIRDRQPKLLILDLGLPGRVDGLEVCRQVRATSDVPIIMLTARDYVTKPFSPRELVARVRAILRRAEGPRPATTTVISVGAVEVDTGRREARLNGVPVALATREFDLLQYLAEHQGLALSRRQLLDGVWGADWIGDDRTVDVHVRQLRKKLGDLLELDTVWGVGYRMG
jgi:DNA-binding response OmpR family regulator